MIMKLRRSSLLADRYSFVIRVSEEIYLRNSVNARFDFLSKPLRLNPTDYQFIPYNMLSTWKLVWQTWRFNVKSPLNMLSTTIIPETDLPRGFWKKQIFQTLHWNKYHNTNERTHKRTNELNKWMVNAIITLLKTFSTDSDHRHWILVH